MKRSGILLALLVTVPLLARATPEILVVDSVTRELMNTNTVVITNSANRFGGAYLGLGAGSSTGITTSSSSSNNSELMTSKAVQDRVSGMATGTPLYVEQDLTTADASNQFVNVAGDTMPGTLVFSSNNIMDEAFATDPTARLWTVPAGVGNWDAAGQCLIVTNNNTTYPLYSNTVAFADGAYFLSATGYHPSAGSYRPTLKVFSNAVEVGTGPLQPASTGIHTSRFSWVGGWTHISVTFGGGGGGQAGFLLYDCQVYQAAGVTLGGAWSNAWPEGEDHAAWTSLWFDATSPSNYHALDGRCLRYCDTNVPAAGGGAQTNEANTWTADQYFQTAPLGLCPTASVSRTGDNMFGTLTITNVNVPLVLAGGDGGTNLWIMGGSSSGEIRIGNVGADGGYAAWPSILIGHNTAAGLASVALGHNASAAGSSGTAVGHGANGAGNGTAVVGQNANGYSAGSALGATANGVRGGVALGWIANGSDYGVAAGYSANGTKYSVALGSYGVAGPTNIAIGAYANASGGSKRTAIGSYLTNDVDNSTAVRGSLYLDGGTAVYARATFGTGAWGGGIEWQDVGTTTEVVAVDSAGNSTQLSSHDGLKHIAKSQNKYAGMGRVIDLDALAEAVQLLTGQTNLIRYYTFDPVSWDGEQAALVAKRQAEITGFWQAYSNALTDYAEWETGPQTNDPPQIIDAKDVPKPYKAGKKPKWLTDYEANPVVVSK